MKQKKLMPGKHKKSPAQGVAVGSGSRPGAKKTSTPSSAPSHEHHLGRATKGWLK